MNTELVTHEDVFILSISVKAGIRIKHLIHIAFTVSKVSVSELAKDEKKMY